MEQDINPNNTPTAPTTPNLSTASNPPTTAPIAPASHTLKYDKKLLIAVGRSRKAFSWQNKEILWSDFVSQLSATTRTHETMLEYAQMTNGERDNIKDIGGFVGGYLKNGKRNKNSVGNRCLVCLDADKADSGLLDDLDNFFPHAYVVYSTHKHTPEKMRLRVIIPLSRTVTADEYAAISRRIANDLTLERFDPTTFEPERLMFWPSTPQDGEYIFTYSDAAFLDPDTVLATYEDWRDTSLWPTTQSLEAKVKRSAGKQEDPTTKSGIIGAYCRAHTITNVLETVLKDVYTPTDQDDRYTYVGGSTTGGLVVYDDKYAYSHHATDPASGMLCNAFDLVRMHLFAPGSMTTDGADISDNASSVRLMQEYASKDGATRKQLAEERMAEAKASFTNLDETEASDRDKAAGGAEVPGGAGASNRAEVSGGVGGAERTGKATDRAKNAHAGVQVTDQVSDQDKTDQVANKVSNRKAIAPTVSTRPHPQSFDPNWQEKLDIDKHGNIKDSLGNLTLILRNDPLLKDISYNLHRSGIDIRKDANGKTTLPWNQIKAGWNEADYGALQIYLDRVYGLYTPNKLKNTLLAVAAERCYHPVRDYIESLPPWDGVPRLSTMFVDYLGSPDTIYTRAIARKMMVAAIARIYEPGVKFDSVVVLNGPQGMGKSSFFAKLGGKWFSDSLTISDMKDKAAPEKLQGYWILELGELAGLKKMDVETVKAFITRQDDKFRHSYGYSVEDHPRQCIIVGSTNNGDGFLRDVTGNRRFWPVTCSCFSQYKPWEVEKVVPQLWAEAYRYYLNGEKLFLSVEEEKQAALEQTSALESDAREGIVEEYLETLLPEDWSKMNLAERRGFLHSDPFTGGNRTGTVRRNTVCAVEIWAECFGKDPSTIKRSDTFDIFGMLVRIGGWVRYAGNKSATIKRSIYGAQRCFVREEMAEETVENMDEEMAEEMAGEMTGKMDEEMADETGCADS